MKKKYIFFELILIIASVFVFRSLWTLMDKVPFFNENMVHIVLLFVGIFFTVYALDKMTKK